ncbi:MAG: ATP-dependent helicase [Lachnospiraceae bacterium]|nr:ATP-dependent helicase [Lachnospiraceae bacterium]
MSRFNKGQLDAIHHINGPMLALAGPGSGKTTAMVHRIKYLIDEAKVRPENILVITFTRASANEMEERFYKLYGSSLNRRPTFGTFHSVFFYILKVAYGYDSGNIFSEENKYTLVKELIAKRQLEYDDEEEVISDIISEISLVKGDMIDVDNYYSPTVGEEVFREIYREYNKTVAANSKLDFDDMMVYCYDLLTKRPDILASLQKRYKYILVDEFQDINKLQYEITKLLAKPDNNLFVVGDDDQSIYGFRGARPEIMLRFKEDYPNAQMTLLDVNYRCNANIVEGSARLIKNNSSRYEKTLVSSSGYEEPIYIHHMKSRSEENGHILEMIRKYHEQGIPYNAMSVIYRTNAQAGSLAHRLLEFNLPFYTRDKVACIYDHFAVRTIFDYINAALGANDRALFLRIINKPNRYISRDLLDEKVVSLDRIKDKLGKKDWIADRITQLSYDLELLTKLKPYAAINFIRKSIGYDGYLSEYADFRHLNVDEFYDVLDEVAEAARQYKTYEDWFASIAAYREELIAHSRANVKEEKKGIAITTMHSAKGLEYDVVFIAEANEGLSPYKKAVLASDIEEERRMFYVAMTRAKHHLHIYEVKHYYNRELEPSRFLSEVVGE